MWFASIIEPFVKLDGIRSKVPYSAQQVTWEFLFIYIGISATPPKQQFFAVDVPE